MRAFKISLSTSAIKLVNEPVRAKTMAVVVLELFSKYADTYIDIGGCSNLNKFSCSGFSYNPLQD